MDPEELAALEAAAAKAAADKEAEDAAKAAKAATDATASNRPSDAEAKLLKEVMKQKENAKAAKEALEVASNKLRDFDGLDPAELRKMASEKKEAELRDAEKRGEYDRIISQVRQDADARVLAVASEKDELNKKLAESQSKIDDLTIGSSFRGSKFLADETVLSGEKARRLYGDHFEIEDGEVVAYDKPRGSSERTPLVDTKTGTKLGFDAAVEKIMKSDPDFESIAKSKLKTGAGSAQSPTDKAAKPNTPAVQGRSLIAAALRNKGKK